MEDPVVNEPQVESTAGDSGVVTDDHSKSDAIADHSTDADNITDAIDTTTNNDSVADNETASADIEMSETNEAPKTAAEDAEPTVAAPVDESGGEEPIAEPVPDVKSPAEIEKSASPAPAIQSSTPPRNQTKKPKVDLASVPVRQYLDTTVVPILLQGLSSLARERPQKPIAYLAQFLMDKASEYDE
ncbi:protein dpy-30 homolog [Oppia nitens]|uniref:protein dpy-30 homolog n=1 Tax=Oppia nitens TaxID=1686743 RepID=UPI0023DAB5C4|nr:protein dpy-30 homolog [Oppia nitens]